MRASEEIGWSHREIAEELYFDESPVEAVSRNL